jgi:hypothetical protein
MNTNISINNNISSTNIKKIQRVSSAFRKCFQIMLSLIPIALILFWVNAHHLEYMRVHCHALSAMFLSDTIAIMHPMTAINKVWGFIISLLLNHGFIMLTLYFLIKLFKLYEKGEIFTQLNVKYVRNIGYTMLASQVAHLFYYPAITLAMTINNPPGHRFSAINFSDGNACAIFTAFIIILISWVMAEGCKLHEEQKYIV